MVELVYALDLKSSVRKELWVQVPPELQRKRNMTNKTLFPHIPSEELMDIPVGSIILVSEPSNNETIDAEASIWFVFAPGKAVVVDNHFPNSETEDLDWFSRWTVTILGVNQNITS